MDTKKKPGFDKKITTEMLVRMRDRFRGLPEMSHDDRAARVQPEFPQFTVPTLQDYSRICLNSEESVFQSCIDGKISVVVLSEIISLDKKTQRFLLTEILDKKLTPTRLREIKRMRKEHGMSWDEAIGRATGKIDVTQPRKGSEKRDLNQLLDRISSQGARWRAMVSEALELIGDEEAAAGIHEEIFTKAFLLRHVVGEQYNFINKRLQRYMTLLRKRAMAQMGQDLKGASDGNGYGTGAQGIDREEIASRED